MDNLLQEGESLGNRGFGLNALLKLSELNELLNSERFNFISIAVQDKLTLLDGCNQIQIANLHFSHVFSI